MLFRSKTKYNFQIHYPGPGVGGPCLPVNSYQYLNTAKEIGIPLKLIQTGREINENMPSHVIRLLKSAFDEENLSLTNSTILILGVSYKPNVKDFQISPAEKIIEQLKKLNVNIKIYDPYFKSENVFGINTESNLIETLAICDGIILVTSHNEFHNLEPKFLKNKLKNPIFIDTRCILNQKDAIRAGLIYRGLGRG